MAVAAALELLRWGNPNIDDRDRSLCNLVDPSLGGGSPFGIGDCVYITETGRALELALL